MSGNNLSPAPQKNSPSGGELFVGLNILSKIGVIFIIIGVIAFSAVSDGYIPAWGRLAMILALGVVMALSLFASAKLFLFDFPSINAMGRTLMFIGFGITLLGISFTYAFFEKRLKNKG